MHDAITILLAVVVILAISVARTYRFIPIVELKRRARSGNKIAKKLYKVACYEFSAQFILWLIAILASSGFFILLVQKSPAWVAFISGVALIWIAFVWIPRSSINIVSEYFAQVIADPLAWVLQYTHPLIDHLQRSKHVNKTKHTKIYEKDDLRELLKRQQLQSDNKINNLELEMLMRVLYFNDRNVKDLLVPKRKVKTVSTTEYLSPVILASLHKTGHIYFPVYEDKPTNVVGLLNINRSIPRDHNVAIKDLVESNLTYVNEDQSLYEVLNLFLSTHQPMLVVVNDQEEYVGIITMKDLIHELLGEQIVDELELIDQNEGTKIEAEPVDEEKKDSE